MGINRSKIARQLLQRGGTTGFEGSPEMGGRGTTETYGFDQSDSSDNVRAERRKEIAKGLGRSAVQLTAQTAFPQKLKAQDLIWKMIILSLLCH